MKTPILILLLLAPLLARAQSAVRAYDTLAGLIAADPRTVTSGGGSTVVVLGRYARGDWGFPRIGKALSSSSLATNVESVFNFAAGSGQIILTTEDGGTAVGVNESGQLVELNLQNSGDTYFQRTGTNASINLQDTAVTPGSYTLANLTVDSKGRLVAVSNGSAGSSGSEVGVSGSGMLAVLNIQGGADVGITRSGTNATLVLETTTVTPGSYSLPSITVDSRGRLTAAANGTGNPVGNGLTNSAGTISTALNSGDNFTLTTNGQGRIRGDVTGVLPTVRIGTGTSTTNTFLQGQGAGVSAAWTTIPSTPSPTNGISDAPADSVQYARLNNAWSGIDVAYLAGLSAFGSNFITGGDAGAIGTTQLAVDSVGNSAIRDQAVNYVNIQDVTADRILGRSGPSDGSVQEIALGSSLYLDGLTLEAEPPNNSLGTNKLTVSAFTALINRGNHTGSQAISTVTGLQGALDGKQQTNSTLLQLATITLATGDLLWFDGINLTNLTKSSTNGTTLTLESGKPRWVNPVASSGLPPGGATGTVLTKTNSTDNAAGWVLPSSSVPGWGTVSRAAITMTTTYDGSLPLTIGFGLSEHTTYGENIISAQIGTAGGENYFDLILDGETDSYEAMQILITAYPVDGVGSFLDFRPYSVTSNGPGEIKFQFRATSGPIGERYRLNVMFIHE